MKKNKRNWIAMATGALFAVYSAYNIFIILRDGKAMNTESPVISAVVALLFGMIAVFVWTTGLMNQWLRILRRIGLIVAISVIFALKLRMVGSVIEYLDFSKMHTILYAASYFIMQTALLILALYYIDIRKRFMLFPRATVIVPVTAMLLFLCSLIVESILLFVYGIGLEANLLRTIVFRPVFYLGFIGLTAYFMYMPTVEDKPTPESLKDEILVRPVERPESDRNREHRPERDDLVILPVDRPKSDRSHEPIAVRDDIVILPVERTKSDKDRENRPERDDLVILPVDRPKSDRSHEPIAVRDDIVILPVERTKSGRRHEPIAVRDDVVVTLEHPL